MIYLSKPPNLTPFLIWMPSNSLELLTHTYRVMRGYKNILFFFSFFSWFFLPKLLNISQMYLSFPSSFPTTPQLRSIVFEDTWLTFFPFSWSSLSSLEQWLRGFCQQKMEELLPEVDRCHSHYALDKWPPAWHQRYGRNRTSSTLQELGGWSERRPYR